MKTFFLSLCLLFAALPGLRAEEPPLNLVPYPASLQRTGGNYNLPAHAELSSLKIAYHKDRSLPAEGYTLEITSKEISIASSDKAGRFYAMQTLRQLLDSAVGHKLPCLHINDHPAYAWRGLMLDVSRHFFSIDYLKKQIDMMAAYKMNRLHLHLTDDQGWRIQIKKYPGLTGQGAFRTFNRQDSALIKRDDPAYRLDPQFVKTEDGKTVYGGYYTQAQMKDLIRYAAARQVEIIPEIDMPGHMGAAIRLFPELSCVGKEGWGKNFSYPLCPANEATFTFVENVLGEIADLFPAPYIHIGEDEVEKASWMASDACNALARKLGYTDVGQLQSYFAERIRKFLAKKGKKVIAWDDLLEEGASPEVAITYWRDWVGGVPQKAIAGNHPLIFVPGTQLYFSRPDSSLYEVYHVTKHFKVVPPDKRNLIMGGQACVWAEGIPNAHIGFRLVYPRLLALSEALWTPDNRKNWPSFVRRVSAQFPFLDKEGVDHTLLSYKLIPRMKTDKEAKAIRLTFESEQPDPVVYYTTDGSVPTTKSPRYTGEILVHDSADICAAIYADGKMQEPYLRRAVDYDEAIGKQVTYLLGTSNSYPAAGAATLTDGLRGGQQYGDGYWQGFLNDLDVVIDMEKPTPLSSFSAMFMQDIGPGVFLPKYVEVSLSSDGKSYTKVLTIDNPVPRTARGVILHKFAGRFAPAMARYVKVTAKNPGGFIFTDELVLHGKGIPLVKEGKAISRIVTDKRDSLDYEAARLLQGMVRRITRARPLILDKDAALRPGDVLIGNFQLPQSGIDTAGIKTDGFLLSTTDGYVRILHGEGKGSLYGVVTLLENYFGVHYYAAGALSLHRSSEMLVPCGIHHLENPSFSYRQTQTYSMKDPLYTIWQRLETPREVFASGLWVHTFNRLLPASVYGKAHPEYYALVNGKRRPGASAQWCLTNPHVFDIVAARLDSIFKANPGMKIISVSQNDSQTHCQCDACRAIDEREGSPSGTIIYFLNKLAKRFPDKEFSTLAYLYSVAPPKHLKPLPNVNIMLCDINCMRELPLTETASGRQFVHDLEGWSAISHNIFVWDYGINFDNYVSPFPNFQDLQPNMQLFKKNGATMHFSQIGGTKGGDFSELRSYLVAKLMWNVNLNVDSLTRDFLNGYYGEGAAPYLYRYLKLREGALIGSGKPLWIYDTPVTHKDGMLKPALMERYKQLFDQAEAASSGVYLERVREARLPIMYAELEIARTRPITDPAALKAKLALFRQRAAECGVSSLNERRNTVEEYCKLYTQRNLSHTRKSLALNCPVRFTLPADSPYYKIEDKALTDGLYGGATFNESWVGWVGRDAEFVIDLGSKKQVQTVEGDFLQSLGAWILLPKSMSCSYAVADTAQAASWHPMGTTPIPEDRSPEVKYVPVSVSLPQSVEARYLKVHVKTIGLCPPWHYGVGYP
ncbi:MAG: DUF4838 domain-containing protein, partial [Tannerella sp.]|nr:DUF4838 domain-containing protein [Tannerella sp.]